jgi:hypothetical protein
MINGNYRSLSSPVPLPNRKPGRRLAAGAVVRAHDPHRHPAETGIVARRRWPYRAEIRWATGETTTVFTWSVRRAVSRSRLVRAGADTMAT